MAGVKSLEELLREINNSLRQVTRRLEKLENDSKMSTLVPHQNFVPGTLSSLPEHLRRSMETIVTLGEANAEAVAAKTGRSRAAESDYLNQLVDRGFLRKQRVGKEIVFQVFDLHTVCPMCGNRVPINVKYCSRCGASLSWQEPILVKNKDSRK